MKKLSKTDRKKIFFNILSPYFTKLGFKKYLTSGDPTYVLINDKIVISLFFNFYSNEEIGCGPLLMTLYEVEDYILNIGIPDNRLIQHNKKEKYHLPTIVLRTKPDNIQGRPLKTISEVEDFAKAYIQFYENQGTKFIEKYSYLPNILAEMDRLRANGQYWREFLAGGPKHLMSGIIISKLCNDLNYEEKFMWLDEIVKTMSPEWLPYWEKYKKVLETIEPKYNIV